MGEGWKMKKVLFWGTSILTFPCFLILDSLASMAEFMIGVLRQYEAWAFEYEKNGYEHLGDGIWVNRSDITD